VIGRKQIFLLSSMAKTTADAEQAAEALFALHSSPFLPPSRVTLSSSAPPSLLALPSASPCAAGSNPTPRSLRAMKMVEIEGQNGRTNEPGMSTAVSRPNRLIPGEDGSALRALLKLSLDNKFYGKTKSEDLNLADEIEDDVFDDGIDEIDKFDDDFYLDGPRNLRSGRRKVGRSGPGSENGSIGFAGSSAVSVRSRSRSRSSSMSSVERMPRMPREGRVGAYSREERAKVIMRFLSKRENRVWKKRVKYEVRKSFADTRIRVKGRFIKKEDEENLRETLVMSL